MAYVTPLSAYLDQRTANERESLGNIQQAGALQTMLANAAKQQKDAEYRSDLSALLIQHGGNVPQEALTTLAAKYSSPHDIITTQQKSLDRKAQVEAAQATAEEGRAARAEEAANNRNFRATEAEKARVARESELQMRLSDARATAADRQATLRELAGIRAEAAKSRAEAQAAAQEDKGVESTIAKTSARLKDVMPVYTAARQLNEVLSRFTPENVPGIGYLKNTDIGKVALSSEGKDVASSQKLLGNSILKAMSGAAVTPSEEVRQMAAMMSDGRYSAKDFYLAWPKIADWVNDQVALGTSGLTPKVKQVFEERTGIKTDRITPRFKTEYSHDGKVSLKDTYAAGGASPSATPEKNAQGWALHVDANGNKAYVSPDGKSFEEVK